MRGAPLPEVPDVTSGGRVFAPPFSTLANRRHTPDKANAAAGTFSTSGERDQAPLLSVFGHGQRPPFGIEIAATSGSCTPRLGGSLALHGKFILARNPDPSPL